MVRNTAVQWVDVINVNRIYTTTAKKESRDKQKEF